MTNPKGMRLAMQAGCFNLLVNRSISGARVHEVSYTDGAGIYVNGDQTKEVCTLLGPSPAELPHQLVHRRVHL